MDLVHFYNLPLYGDSSNCTSQASEHSELSAQTLSAFFRNKVLDINKAVSTVLSQQTPTPLNVSGVGVCWLSFFGSLANE
jgi:hypothetical protein